jgi:hypothetical protein
MEEAPENGKESLNSAHTNGINELINSMYTQLQKLLIIIKVRKHRVSGCHVLKLYSETCL